MLACKTSIHLQTLRHRGNRIAKYHRTITLRARPSSIRRMRLSCRFCGRLQFGVLYRCNSGLLYRRCRFGNNLASPRTGRCDWQVQKYGKLLEMRRMSLFHFQNHIKKWNIQPLCGSQFNTTPTLILFQIYMNRIHFGVMKNFQQAIIRGSCHIHKHIGNGFSIIQMHRNFGIKRLTEVACHIQFSERKRARLSRPRCNTQHQNTHHPHD